MSKISKKLLSLAMVLAMVLSMTPVISLPAAAAVTNPSEATDPMAAAAQNIADVRAWHNTWKATFSAEDKCVAGATVEAPCPFCSPETAVVWTGTTTLASGVVDGCHLYLVADFDGNNSIVGTSTATKQCVYTNQKAIGGAKGARLRVRGNLNVIAYGSTLTHDENADAGYVLIQGAGVGSIYGGTFINEDPDCALVQAASENMNISLYDGTYTSAGAFYMDAAKNGPLNIYGSTITGGAGATFTMTNGATVNVYGNDTYPTTITGGTGFVDGETYFTDENSVTHYGTRGGNVYANPGTFNLYGGSIYGGTATGIKDDAGTSYGGRGGNVYLGADATFNMYGGKVYGGKIEVLNGGPSYGGNVMLYPATARLNMSGNAEIYGGEADNGGNVMLRSSNEMTMSGNAKVYDGVASTGPNIYLMNGSNPKLTMSGNATVYGGAQPDGDVGNIRLYGGTLVMEDNATVLGGEGDGSAISVMFNQNPLIVLKDKATVKSATGTIKNQINDGRILITEGWEGEAYTALLHDDGKAGYGYGEQIATTRALCGTYDAETETVTAANVNFTGKLYVSSYKIEAQADSTVTGGLKLPEEPVANAPVFGTFDPAGCEGKAYCEACYKQALAAGKSDTEAKAAALVEWTAYDYKYNTNTELKKDDTHEHLYLTEDLTAFSNTRLLNMNAGTVCLNLNGKSITKDPSASRGALFCTQGADAVLNIMDEKMEGKGASVLIGVAPNNIARGAAFRIDAGTCNVYGGTYKDAAPADLDNIWRVATVAVDGTLNLFEGAVIDGTNETSTRQTVYMKGTMTLDGGEIIGRTAMSGNSGSAVCVDGGTFNMKSGSIHNGVAGVPDDAEATKRNGGNVSVIAAGTFNMSGGHIYGGVATGAGENVYLEGGSTMIMSGTAKITGLNVEGNAIHAGGTGTTLVLKDKATIEIPEGFSVGNVRLYSNDDYTGAKLVIDPNWEGFASVYLITYGPNTDTGSNDHAMRHGETVNINYGVCGTYDAATGNVTAGGAFTGELYRSTADRPLFAKAETGELYTPSFSIEKKDSRSWYTDFAAVLENYDVADEAYIAAWTEAELTLTEDAYIASMSSRFPAKVSGAYKLYVMDTTQDDYAGTTYYWTVAEETEVVRDVTNPVTGNRYLNITTGVGEGTETITSTRLDLGLKTVTLRAGKTSEGMGLYYKAKMSMSTVLANKVNTYGVVLSLVDMPKANFVSEGVQNGFTALETETNPIGVSADNDYTVILNSGAVFGIMKPEYETLPEGYETKQDYNAYRGTMPVYANAYLQIDLDGDGTFEYVMAYDDKDVAWSLYDVMDAIDEKWTSFAAAQEKITSFYSFWYEHGMNKWAFDNIKNETV